MDDRKEAKGWIGASMLRKEDARHLHGRGMFIADVAMPGVQDVAFVRSQMASARVRAVTKPSDGAGRVFTLTDLGPINVLEAGPGDLLCKPRGVPHAFWNAGDAPARLLELISPAGFENYFRALALLLAAPERDEVAIGEVVARFQLDIDFGTIPVLTERHGLRPA